MVRARWSISSAIDSSVQQQQWSAVHAMRHNVFPDREPDYDPARTLRFLDLEDDRPGPRSQPQPPAPAPGLDPPAPLHHHMASVMAMAWKRTSSGDFSALPLGSFLPHERRLLSLSASPPRRPKLLSMPLPCKELLSDPDSDLYAQLHASADRVQSPATVPEHEDLVFKDLQETKDHQEEAPAPKAASPNRPVQTAKPAATATAASATAAAKRARGRRPMSVRVFNAKLNALAQKGAYGEVEKLLKAAENGSIRLDRPPNTRSFTIAVKAYCRADRTDLAAALVAKMKAATDASMKPNRFTLNTLLNGFVRRSQIDSAAALFAEMRASKDPSAQPDQVTYSTMIKGLASAGDMVHAEELFQELRSKAFGAAVVNYVTCNTMVKGYASLGDMRRAEKLFLEMLQRGDRKSGSGLCGPDKVTFNTMIDGYAKSGRMRCAERVFEKMWEMKDRKKTRPNQVTLNTLIDGYVKTGDMKSAEEVFAVLEGVKKLESLVEQIKRKIAEEQYAVDESKAENIDSAKAEEESLLRLEEAFKELSFKETGDFENSQLYPEEMDDETGTYDIEDEEYGNDDKSREEEKLSPSAVTFGAMINGYVKSGDMRKAEQMFNRIRDTANQVTYTTMIGSYAKMGDMAKAEELFSEMISAPKSAGRRPNQVTYSILIDGYAKLGEMEKAESLLRKMVSWGCKPNQVTYNTLIHGYAQKGDVRQAEAVFRFMEKSEDEGCKPNVVTLRTMAQMYRSAGRLADSAKLTEMLRRCSSTA